MVFFEIIEVVKIDKSFKDQSVTYVVWESHLRAVREEVSILVWLEGCHVNYYSNLYFVSKTELIGHYDFKLDRGLYYVIGNQDHFTLQAI